MKKNVLITSTSFQDTPGIHHEILKSQDWSCDYERGPLNEEEIHKIIDKYDAVLCGDDDYTDKVLLKGSKAKLKILSKYGVGLDKINLKSAEKYNIRVTNCPGINQVSVSEHVMALLLTYEKNIHHQYNSVKKFSWKRMIGNELKGKKIAILGCGNIGKEVVKKCLAFEMKVNVFDLKKDNIFHEKYPEIKFFKCIESIIQDSEIISLHLPLNESTSEIINNRIITKFMNSKTLLINTARSGLIETKALISSLKSNKIRGYLTDVLDDEPIKKENKMVGLSNVIITPHIGSRTYQNVVKQGLKAVNNLIDFFKL